MLTAVPAEGYLALWQHRILLCAASIFFQGCVSPLPCPHSRVGAFFTVFSESLSQSARVDASAARLASGSGRQKNTHSGSCGLWVQSLLADAPSARQSG